MAKKQNYIVHKNGKKEFPKELLDLIQKGVTEVKKGFLHVMKGDEYCRQAVERGKKLGIDPKEVGDKYRELLRKEGISDRTIQRWLPSEAKALPRGIAVAKARRQEEEPEQSTTAASQTEDFTATPTTETKEADEEINDKVGVNQGVAEQKAEETDNQKLAEKFEGRGQEQEKKELSPELREHLESLPMNPRPKSKQISQPQLDEIKEAIRATNILIDFVFPPGVMEKFIADNDSQDLTDEQRDKSRIEFLEATIEHLKKRLAQIKEKHPKKKQSKEDTPYEKTRNYALTVAVPMGVDSDDKWSRHVKSPDFPTDIPKRPDAYYLKRGQWKENGGWIGFFGKSNPKVKGEEVTATVAVEAQA